MSSEDRWPSDQPSKPLLIVLSGLSGAGKDAVLDGLRHSHHSLEFVVTVTTRPPRPGEQDGVSYRFVDPEMFQEMIGRGELIEHARVYGNWYGVPREPIREALAASRDVIVKVDVQGAATIRRLAPQALLIFLTPPSLDDLVLRLRERGSESASDFSTRVSTAQQELKRLPLFDYVVINRQGQIDRAVADIEAIITAEKCRVSPRDISL